MYISKKYTQAVFLTFMTFLMASTISLVFTYLGKNGHCPDTASFLSTWITAFIRTWLIVLPTAIVMSKVARKLTNLVVKK